MELDLVGQTLAGRYLIESELGAGAMGAVFRARHVKVGRLFAVKVLHPRLVENPKLLKRFEREAELAGSLHHPNVIGVIDVGETPSGYRYLVMEHADGEPLSDVIARGPISGDRVIRIVRQLCEGLNHAHARGMIHRDFKPENVILEKRSDGSEVPRIVDFGIAILREDLTDGDRERLTTDGVILGTPYYMAPEQAFGGPFDHRIDLFALGIICYEMLTGRLPFDGDGVEVARANISSATTPMGVRVPLLEIDPLLEAFTRRLMKKSPDARPASANAASELLELIERDRGEAARALDLDPDLAARCAPPITTAESLPLAVDDRDRIPTTPMATLPIEAEILSVDRRPPRRRLVIGGAAVAAIGIASAAIYGARPGEHQRQTTVSSTGEPTDAAPTSPTPDAQPAVDAHVAAIDARRAAVDAGVIADAPARQIADAAVRRPSPDAGVQEPEISARTVADLYVVVGRELKAYGDRDATAATPLWSRYRLIRINDAMASSSSQRAAVRELREIRASIKK